MGLACYSNHYFNGGISSTAVICFHRKQWPPLTLKEPGTKTGVRGPWSRLTGEKSGALGKVRTRSQCRGKLFAIYIKTSLNST